MALLHLAIDISKFAVASAMQRIKDDTTVANIVRNGCLPTHPV